MAYFLDKKPKNFIILFFFSIAFFLIMGVLLLFSQTFSLIDFFFFRFAGIFFHPFLTDFFIVLTRVFNHITFSAISLSLFLFLLSKKEWFHAFCLAFSLFFGFFFFWFSKIFFQIERPLEGLIPVSGFSFPSGHATLSAVFFLMLFLSLKGRDKKEVYNFFLGFFCIFSLLTVGFSRIYLHVHRLSDVLAGFLLGIAIVSFFYVMSSIFFNRMEKNSQV